MKEPNKLLITENGFIHSKEVKSNKTVVLFCDGYMSLRYHFKARDEDDDWVLYNGEVIIVSAAITSFSIDKDGLLWVVEIAHGYSRTNQIFKDQGEAEMFYGHIKEWLFPTKQIQEDDTL